MYFVRTASERDVDAIRDLLIETWHATYDALHGVEKIRALVAQWHTPQAIRANILKKGGEFLVADNGKKLGGMGFASMSQSMTKTAVLHQLYVRPSCQNEGIGRDIFAELETCFPDAEIMRLEVDAKNPRAMSFYSRIGFVEVDRTMNCGKDDSGIEAVIMEKPLEQ